MTTARLYYEVHITLDPVPEADRPALQTLLDVHGFKLAKLLMERDKPSTLDTFATYRGRYLETTKNATAFAVIALRVKGYVVRRWKIEDTLFDSRHGDTLRDL